MIVKIFPAAEIAVVKDWMFGTTLLIENAPIMIVITTTMMSDRLISPATRYFDPIQNAKA